MHSYTKPNIILPISLHDAIVTKLRVQPATSKLIDGVLIFEFQDGFINVEKNDSYWTGKATVTISGIDFDFSHVYYYLGEERKDVPFSKLAEDIKMNRLEIIDETYGYNQTKFSCIMFEDDEYYDVEIEIYHFQETVYHWEDPVEMERR
ncbi:hypothetical protein [Fervidibacillus halotolerans]|uniref:Uncharacterized protein n=1 Tax=Fervidibacillus halotolerans TaxID=2980027 RepID=A0A9E8LZQ3_9BACI|nr:hypothetical protein [Fervidibacillus halotolerans]WAA12685.1 hypothetical protein OE105_00635 [Fervidibacillus halotolerans]